MAVVMVVAGSFLLAVRLTRKPTLPDVGYRPLPEAGE